MKKFGLEVEEKQKRLATLYWTAKMHYDPPRARFIAASGKCVLKVLSKLLSKCLKLVKEQWRRKCNTEKWKRKTKLEKCWIVKSTEDVLRKIDRANERNKAKDVGSFDFSTLYTKIEHEALLAEMKWLIRGAFEDSGKKKIAVYSKEAKWVDQGREGTKTVDEKELIEMVEYLVTNMMIIYGDKVYSQWIGIPMGTDCAPFLANLYLFALEYKWMTKIEEENDVEKLRILENSWRSRYIDYFFSINGTELLEEELGELYRGLRRRTRRITNKRDDFPFEARRFPDLEGNVHHRRAHGMVMGQVGRFVKSNDTVARFEERMKDMTTRLLDQHFVRSIIEEKIRKYYSRNADAVKKYGKDESEFVAECFRSNVARKASCKSKAWR